MSDNTDTLDLKIRIALVAELIRMAKKAYLNAELGSSYCRQVERNINALEATYNKLVGEVELQSI